MLRTIKLNLLIRPDCVFICPSVPQSCLSTYLIFKQLEELIFLNLSAQRSIALHFNLRQSSANVLQSCIFFLEFDLWLCLKPNRKKSDGRKRGKLLSKFQQDLNQTAERERERDFLGDLFFLILAFPKALMKMFFLPPAPLLETLLNIKMASWLCVYVAH